jgi:hypothetical protein
MNSKKIYNNLNLRDVFEKKIAVNAVYPKNYIRDSFFFEKKFFLLDNNQCLLHVKTKSNKLVGCSLNLPLLKFRHNLKNSYSFEIFLCFKKTKSGNTSKVLYQNLHRISQGSPKKKLPVLILKPIKGGFKCYSFGFLGFIPGSQMTSLLEKNRRFMLEEKGLSLNEAKFLCSPSYSNSIFFKHRAMRLPFFCADVVFYPTYKTQNFSRPKAKIYRASLSFVFISFVKEENIKKENVKKKKFWGITK